MANAAQIVDRLRRELAVKLAVAGRRLTPLEIDIVEAVLEEAVREARRSWRVDPRLTPAGGLFPEDEDTTPRGRLPRGPFVPRK